MYLTLGIRFRILYIIMKESWEAGKEKKKSPADSLIGAYIPRLLGRHSNRCATATTHSPTLAH